jgi:hypothetical protein
MGRAPQLGGESAIGHEWQGMAYLIRQQIQCLDPNLRGSIGYGSMLHLCFTFLTIFGSGPICGCMYAGGLGTNTLGLPSVHEEVLLQIGTTYSIALDQRTT